MRVARSTGSLPVTARADAVLVVTVVLGDVVNVLLDRHVGVADPSLPVLPDVVRGRRRRGDLSGRLGSDRSKYRTPRTGGSTMDASRAALRRPRLAGLWAASAGSATSGAAAGSATTGTASAGSTAAGSTTGSSAAPALYRLIHDRLIHDRVAGLDRCRLSRNRLSRLDRLRLPQHRLSRLNRRRLLRDRFGSHGASRHRLSSGRLGSNRLCRAACLVRRRLSPDRFRRLGRCRHRRRLDLGRLGRLSLRRLLRHRFGVTGSAATGSAGRRDRLSSRRPGARAAAPPPEAPARRGRSGRLGSPGATARATRTAPRTSDRPQRPRQGR